MSDFPALPIIPPDFSGTVRLFPLPNLVMFPNVIQPLHIFEPRYREMLEDALRGDQIIAMALLMPDWQADYEGRPAIASVACLGRVVSHARDEQGRYNILLLGAQRAKVTRELPPEHAYRTARVALLNDHYPLSGAVGRSALRRKLLELFRTFVPEIAAAKQQFDQLLSSQIPLGMLTDIIAFTIKLKVSLKQHLLSECDVDQRATLLVKELSALAPDAPPDDGLGKPRFPPDFSMN